MTNKYLITGPVTREVLNDLMGSFGEDLSAGGHSLFIGQVRADSTGGRRVSAIEYSAYENMVNKEADKIIEGIYSSFNDVRSVKIIHSTGVVRAGEISLFVLVSAGHRRQAIEACETIVEQIKERLPVWKQEIFEDSTREWKSNNFA